MILRHPQLRCIGGGKRASERVNSRCDERLLETVHLGVVTPGLAASEERHGGGRLRHDNPRKAHRPERWRQFVSDRVAPSKRATTPEGMPQKVYRSPRLREISR